MQIFSISVCDESGFRDESLLYRFRKDDGTFPWHEDVAIFLRGQRLHHRSVKLKLGTLYKKNFSETVNYIMTLPNQIYLFIDCVNYVCAKLTANNVME